MNRVAQIRLDDDHNANEQGDTAAA
jgi:hypothetical protein